MPQVTKKHTQAVDAVPGSKRQTYNSTKGEVLLTCEEDDLSESQQEVYTEHEQKMKAYTKALEAYNKAYGLLDMAGAPTEGASQNPATASMSCEGNPVVQNGVAPQQTGQRKPQLLDKPILPGLLLQPQQTASAPVAPVAKQTTVATGESWRPQMVAKLVNKAVLSPAISVSSMVGAQQVVPRVVNAVNQSAPRTVIQVPVGTDLSNMQVVNVGGSTSNYQLLLQPQVAYPTLNAVPVGQSVLPQPAPIQNILMPVTASMRTANPVTSQVGIVSGVSALSGTAPNLVTNQVRVNTPNISAGKVQNIPADKVQNVSAGKVQNVSAGKVQNVSAGKVQNVSAGKVQNVSAGKVQNVSAGKVQNASAGKYTTIQTISVSTAARLSNKGPGSSQAGSNKRTAPGDGETRRSKRSKGGHRASSQPDEVEGYYGWRQGRLWWDDKPKGSFRCYVCNKKLPTNVRYMQHVRHHLEKEQLQNSIKNNIFSCRSCFKNFKTACALRDHKDRYHQPCEFRCGICEVPFDDKQSLLKHLSRHHQALQMPYVCGVCNYASSIYDDLILHFNKHHEGSNALLCPFCVRIIKCNNAFMRHCKTHLTVSIKNGYFHCGSCKLMFLNNDMLKEHLQEDHKVHTINYRSGIPSLPSVAREQPAEAVSVQKVSFPKQSPVKVAPSLWSRREIIKPRGHLRCMECGVMIDHCTKHFRRKMKCNRCRYITYCGTAFANHMIVFHKAGSSPKLHRVRKTVVNNGRILLGCRNCEFSTLSPTLMTCHIESCPCGSLVIESFKVRTHSLQSSRNYKREVLPVNMKTAKPPEDDAEDDDVVVIEEEVLVDLTDDAQNSGKELSPPNSKPTAEEPKMSESVLKNVSLTVKLEKLSTDLKLDKVLLDKGNDTGGNNKSQTETDPEDRTQEQMEVDKSSNENDNSNDSAVLKAPSEDVQNNVTNTGERAEGRDEKRSLQTAVDSDEASMSRNVICKDKIETSEDKHKTTKETTQTCDKNGSSEDKDKVTENSGRNNTLQLRIKQEQIDS